MASCGIRVSLVVIRGRVVVEGVPGAHWLSIAPLSTVTIGQTTIGIPLLAVVPGFGLQADGYGCVSAAASNAKASRPPSDVSTASFTLPFGRKLKTTEASHFLLICGLLTLETSKMQKQQGFNLLLKVMERRRLFVGW